MFDRPICDAHAHAFTPDLEMSDLRRAPHGSDAPWQTYLAELDAHGVSHGVLVQPSFLGTDNRYLISALKANPQRLRGVVVVGLDISAQELEAMDRVGVVGIRLNLIGLATPDLRSPPWQELLGHVKRLDWHVEVHQEARRLQEVLEPLLQAGVKVVVDHFGRPDPELGVQDPGFDYLLGLGPTGQVWVKLSAAYRNGVAGAEAASTAIPLLRRAYGLQRLLWGSDWPHTRFEFVEHYDRAMQALHQYLPDGEDRAQAAWYTAHALFKFGGA